MLLQPREENQLCPAKPSTWRPVVPLTDRMRTKPQLIIAQTCAYEGKKENKYIARNIGCKVCTYTIRCYSIDRNGCTQHQNEDMTRCSLKPEIVQARLLPQTTHWESKGASSLLQSSYHCKSHAIKTFLMVHLGSV